MRSSLGDVILTEGFQLLFSTAWLTADRFAAFTLELGYLYAPEIGCE